MISLKSITALVAAGILLMATACNEGQKSTTSSAPQQGKAIQQAPAGTAMNVRYIDADSIYERYNLAKEIKESILKLQNNLQSRQKTFSDDINKLAAQIEQRRKSNYYATKEAFDADANKLQQMQNRYSNELQKLQQSAMTQEQQLQKQLTDSVNNYLKIYAQEKGYDAITYRSAYGYIDPKFDVTTDVIKGLNRRYVKVAKK